MIPSGNKGLCHLLRAAAIEARLAQAARAGHLLAQAASIDPTYRYHLPRRLLSTQASPWRLPLSNPRRALGHQQSSSILQLLPRRAFHAAIRGQDKAGAVDSSDNSRRGSSSANIAKGTSTLGTTPTSTATTAPTQDSTAKAADKSHDHFYDRLHLPQFHRPTKEELLAAATGFWSRLRVRFKWATIKSVRPYNLDEIFGFFSWIFLGHLVWIILGTTTFVSLAIFAINTVFAQETLARWVGNYLTHSSGLQVVFESAIVPKWSDGVITFKNVFVSRRPGLGSKYSVTKGSPEDAALTGAREHIPEEDQNYTQFDVNIGEVNVTLSFSKWWNSKGPLKDVSINHIRGVIDRTHVHWDNVAILDPKSYRREHLPGDFEIENFTISDLLLTVHQPNNFRPFTVSIFDGTLPRLRKQWLFYDFLCANHMNGEFDGSLFTIHRRQTHSFTGADLPGPNDPAGHSDSDPWKRQSRIRIDALNIDHLNYGYTGPFSWITEGNVDIAADLLIPSDADESPLKLMSDFYERMEATLTSKKLLPQTQDAASQAHLDDHHSTALSTPGPPDEPSRNDDKRFLLLDMRINLNDVRASVPIFTSDLSYINNALIRPIVAYINSRRTFIPLNCRVVKRASDFDGSWTLFDSGLMDDLSAEVYDAFARDVTDEQARMRRFKKVGLWGVQLAAQAIFIVLSGAV
ncbi:hypothetical protein DV735_g3211, partial [Chaetothyriales sp. CBS 134920]